MKRTLTDADFLGAARRLQCKVAALRAVAAVEAPAGGFLSDGRPRVLFEGHHFHRLTEGRFAQSHPTLSYPKWTRRHYARGKDADARGAGELARLDAAIALDRQAALKSASYGKFQIMGSNHRLCMYPDVESFYMAMNIDEQKHLDAFCHFLKSRGFVVALRELDWARFALYNGPAFRKNDYDGKLARAYATFVGAKVVA
ncbi:MAG: N-acetylmuramidase family protein [bacterium]